MQSLGLDHKVIPNMKWEDIISAEVLSECIEATSFDEAVKELGNSNVRGVITPMKNMPFERDANYHLSAILPIRKRGFFLQNKNEAINLSLLGESQTIHYTHDFILDYVRDFNQKVKLNKISEDQKGSHLYVISSEDIEGAIPLSQQEFVPECGEGIYAIVCRKSDIDFRQKVMEFHDESAADISNLQRKIKLACGEYQLLGVFVEKDVSAHLHCVVAHVKEGLQYVSHSQSTSHEFVHFMKLKM